MPMFKQSTTNGHPVKWRKVPPTLRCAPAPSWMSFNVIYSVQVTAKSNKKVNFACQQLVACFTWRLQRTNEKHEVSHGKSSIISSRWLRDGRQRGEDNWTELSSSFSWPIPRFDKVETLALSNSSFFSKTFLASVQPSTVLDLNHFYFHHMDIFTCLSFIHVCCPTSSASQTNRLKSQVSYIFVFEERIVYIFFI